MNIIKSLVLLSLLIPIISPAFSNGITHQYNLKQHFTGLVDIGHGRKIYLECQGIGTPTVILISGLGDRADSWQESYTQKSAINVFNEVSKTTRVCAYDRPGTVYIKETHIETSRSDAIKQPITIKDSVTDLHALLISANVPGPYILAGHSAGGLIARLYTSQYPSTVAGLVLIDALSENLHAGLSDADWKYFNEKLNGIPKEVSHYHDFERIDFVSSFKQLRPTPELPAIIITADKPPDFVALKAIGRLPQGIPRHFEDNLWKAQIKAQYYLAGLFPHAKHITKTNSGHYIHIENTRMVIKSILDIIATVRKNNSYQYPNKTKSYNKP